MPLLRRLYRRRNRHTSGCYVPNGASRLGKSPSVLPDETVVQRRLKFLCPVLPPFGVNEIEMKFQRSISMFGATRARILSCVAAATISLAATSGAHAQSPNEPAIQITKQLPDSTQYQNRATPRHVVYDDLSRDPDFANLLRLAKSAQKKTLKACARQLLFEPLRPSLPMLL